jgi:hypothetical protein
MRSDEFEVPVEIPSAEEMLKKAGWANDKKEQIREGVKEAIETAAENGSTFVEVAGKLPDSVVHELENLGYRVIYQGEDAPFYWGPFNTDIIWREVK